MSLLDDILQRRIGKCQACLFMGVLLRKPFLSPDDLNSISGDVSDALPVLDLCLTCFGTPMGFYSENRLHLRLPEAEYKR